MPHNVDPNHHRIAVAGFSSGYVAALDRENAETRLEAAWRLYQNYALDIVTLRYARSMTAVMQYLRVRACVTSARCS